MIYAFVGSGGKTTLLKNMADKFRREGKTVLVTPSTHMFIESDALVTDEPDTIIRALQKTGYAMAGLSDGVKLCPLSKQTFDAVLPYADVVLVEADGSRMLPLKFPNSSEPVIPENTDVIYVVCGLNAVGQKAVDVCHRIELVKECLGIQEDTIITLDHVKTLVTEGYLRPLHQKFPNAQVILSPRDNGSPQQQIRAEILRKETNVPLEQE